MQDHVISKEVYLKTILVTDIAYHIRKALDIAALFEYKTLNNSKIYVSNELLSPIFAIDHTDKTFLYSLSFIRLIHKNISYATMEEIMNYMELAIKFLFGSNYKIKYTPVLANAFSDYVFGPVNTYILGESLKYAC